MKTDTSLLVVGGADEQVSQSSTVSRGYRGLRQKAGGGGEAVRPYCTGDFEL